MVLNRKNLEQSQHLQIQALHIPKLVEERILVNLSHGGICPFKGFREKIWYCCGAKALEWKIHAFFNHD